MIKSKAFVDTTILTNRLIKRGIEKSEAKSALARYSVTQLPVYAIKEFKAGPLDYAKYLYNKLLETGSISGTMNALSRIWMQRNRQATCYRLIEDSFEAAESRSSADLRSRYGNLANPAEILYDSVKYETKMLVMKSWNRCRTLTTEVVNDLPCYSSTPPQIDRNGQLVLSNTKCNTDDCCMGPELRDRKRFSLSRLRVAIKRLPDKLRAKDENVKRAALLREINSNPYKKITDSDCRHLGDAVFALYCPSDADILTTNLVDHVPLALALRKTALSPKQVLDE